MRLFWLFLVVPLIEIWLFIQMGGLMGTWPTIGLVILTAVIGAVLMRAQGAKAWLELQRSISELRDPTRSIAHGAMILLAGAMLMTPGFFTDFLGIALLIPQFRDLLMQRVGRNVRTSVNFGSGYDEHRGRPSSEDGIVDADFVEIDPSQEKLDHESPRPRGDSGWTRH